MGREICLNKEEDDDDDDHFFQLLPKSASKNLKLNTFQKTNKSGQTIG